jgi:4-hydroxy-tetrahydrodipicolinate reductase
MNQTIKIGMFGLGKAGKEVTEQFINDPAVKLCWIVRGSNAPLTEHLPEDIPVYIASELDLAKLIKDKPVDFVVDFSSADTCLSYADIMAKHKVGIISAVSAYQEHDSISRAAFGQGALYAIKNLYERPAGFYTMEQLVSEGFSAALA